MSKKEDVQFRVGEKYLSKSGRSYRRKMLFKIQANSIASEEGNSSESHESFMDINSTELQAGNNFHQCMEDVLMSEYEENEYSDTNINDNLIREDEDDANSISDDGNGDDDEFNQVYDGSESENGDDDDENKWNSFYTKKVPLRDDLVCWYMSNVSVTKQALNQLLKILNKHGISKSHNIPVDSRTLIKTSDKIEPKEVSGGESVHFGLERCVRFLHKNNIQLPDHITFDINVDGAQVFNNPYCNISIWPILTNFTNIKGLEKVVLPISIFCSSKKPSSLDFLNEFIEEYETIRHGLQIGSKLHTLELKLIRLDIPAHSFLCSTISHTGYFSCFKCQIKGEYYANKVIFPVVDDQIEKRTNQSFRNQEQREHHVGESNLLQIDDLDMIEDIPIDPMHNVYLGVMKKQLWIWLFSNKTDPGRLGDETINGITSMIKQIKGKLPVEFHRNLRSLDQMKKYKAKELRMFLLYIGPYVLKKFLSSSRFSHFMKLHTAIKILSDCDFSKNENMLKLAHQLIHAYSIGIESLYDKRHSTYNMHLMSHLDEEVRLHGPLDSFSNFIFENFLGFLKTLIKSPNAPLQQMSNRYNEIFNYGKVAEQKAEIICDDIRQKVFVNGITISAKYPNSIILLKSREVFSISHIEKNNRQIILTGKKLQTSDYFTDPIKSSTINCFKAKESTESPVRIDFSLVARKMVPFRIDDSEMLVIPMTNGF